MSAHTPGPWRAWTDGLADYIGPCSDDSFVAELSHRSADTARIVACVNACEGIADPAALRAERDALLAALRAIAESCDGPPQLGWDFGRGWKAAHDKIGAYARAALAGGAA